MGRLKKIKNNNCDRKNEKLEQWLGIEKLNNIEALKKWNNNGNIFLEMAEINLNSSGTIKCIEQNDWLINHWNTKINVLKPIHEKQLHVQVQAIQMFLGGVDGWRGVKAIVRIA